MRYLLSLFITIAVTYFLFTNIAKSSQYPALEIRLRESKIILSNGSNAYKFPTSENYKSDGIKKVLQEDVNGDGVKEYIIGAQLREGSAEAPYSCVLIGKPTGKKIDIQKQIVTGDYFGDVQLFDVNKDSIKDIVITGTSGMHYSDLAIIGWRNDKYETWWDTGSPSGVFFETDKDGNAQIRIGVSLTEKQGWSYADKPEWKIWKWQNDKFVNFQDTVRR